MFNFGLCTHSPKLNMIRSHATGRSGRSVVRSQCPACRLRRPLLASFAEPPPTLARIMCGACSTLQVVLSSAVTCGVYWLETESPMTRQFGSVSEIGPCAPNPALARAGIRYLQPFA